MRGDPVALVGVLRGGIFDSVVSGQGKRMRGSNNNTDRRADFQICGLVVISHVVGGGIGALGSPALGVRRLRCDISALGEGRGRGSMCPNLSQR